MTESHDFRTNGRHSQQPRAPMLNLIPYEARQMLRFGTSFDSSKLSGMTYSYATVQDYRTDHEQKCSAPIPSNHCDGGSPTSTTGNVKPFHLNAFQQDRPRTAFEDNRRTHRLLNAEQSYLDSDTIQSSAYYLEDGFHALEQSPFSSTSNFETTHHGLYQNPYSNSLTPASESHSPIVALPKTQDNMVERSSCREGTVLGREDLEEDDMSSDKPYARLIWEALMQAPGHRLMLREIYSWFECNTNKAIESGSNGWQNSVRHNLSMNQAFENDKSTSSDSRTKTKKANSVWVLTENAIKNGVQSTTRYRRTGSGKKTRAGRTPAPLRQRSGARGGRAARRAAKLRRHQQDHSSHQFSFPGIPSPPDSYGSIGINGTTNDTDYMSIHTPATPTNELSYSFSAVFDIPTYPSEMPLFYSNEEEYLENVASVQQEFAMQPQKDSCVDGMKHFQYGPNASDIQM